MKTPTHTRQATDKVRVLPTASLGNFTGTTDRSLGDWDVATSWEGPPQSK